MTEKLFKIPQYPNKALAVECDWADAEFLKMVVCKRDVGDKEDASEFEELYIYISGCCIDSLWKRLKLMWHILWNGEFENDGVMIGKEKLQSVVKYLNEVIEYWTHLEEEDKKVKEQNAAEKK